MKNQTDNKFKVRVSCVVFYNDEVALIRRFSNSDYRWSLPGGNVNIDEDIETAIKRELKEEMGLREANPELLFIQDMLISKPSHEGIYRKLHVVFKVAVTADIKSQLNATEEDDLGSGDIIWIPKSEAATLTIYPLVGSGLAHLGSLSEPVSPRILPPMNDQNYQWE